MSTKATKELIADSLELKREIFKILRNYILNKATVEEIQTTFSSEMFTLFSDLIKIFFKMQQLKKGVINTYVKEDIKFLGITAEQSLTKRSDLLKVLELRKSVKKLESQEDEKPRKHGGQLSGITVKLCVYYDNIFIILETMEKFEASLSDFASEMQRTGKCGKLKISWEMKPLFETCDDLLEVIALRISLYDSKDFLRFIKLTLRHFV